MNNEIKQVCVYCASSTKIDRIYFDAAEELGKTLAHKKIDIINGAGNMGLMRAVSDAALAEGGKVTGVIPRFMREEGWAHSGLTKIIETETMHERKRLMAEMSDAVIAMPGGCGTMEELLEIITWKQLGLYLGPVIILNTGGFYNPLLQMLDNAIEGHFMRPVHRNIWSVACNVEEVMTELHNPKTWNREIRKFAAI